MGYKNPEDALAYRHRNKDKRRRYAKDYYQKNKDFVKAKVYAYKEKNLEIVKEKSRKRAKQQRETNPEFVKRRARHYALKRKYGITIEQYEEILQKQNNSCAICERHESEFKTRLAVDHNHVTREIRGLLCTNCNYRLVARHRDGELLRKIADYIEQGTGWLVPEKPKKRKRS